MSRVEHTRLRRRLLYGLATDDCRQRVLSRLQSIERADAWGIPDETGNLFPAGCKMLAQLYTPAPPRPTGPRGTEAVVEAAAAGGLWDLLIRGQRDAIGMREWLVRVDAVEDEAALLGWSLAYRPVYPDRVVARGRRDACDLPAYIAEAVLLADHRVPGVSRWYWDVWSIEDPSAPYHELRTDLSPGGEVLQREAGDTYPHRDELGRPVVPYSLYHAERTGYLWDPWEWREAVEGALNLVVHLTLFGHVVLKAAWSQRYSVGVDWGGGQDETDHDGDGNARPRNVVVSDPAVLMQGVYSSTDEGTPSAVISQWAPPIDPEVLIRAITVYERRVMRAMGIEEVDVTKASADPRSGYALEVDSGRRDEMRMRYLPAFRRGDLETLRISAAVLGSAAGVPLPSRGYTIEYGPALPDPEEVDDGGGSRGNGGSEDPNQGPGGSAGSGEDRGRGAPGEAGDY